MLEFGCRRNLDGGQRLSGEKRANATIWSAGTVLLLQTTLREKYRLICGAEVGFERELSECGVGPRHGTWRRRVPLYRGRGLLWRICTMFYVYMTAKRALYPSDRRGSQEMLGGAADASESIPHAVRRVFRSLWSLIFHEGMFGRVNTV